MENSDPFIIIKVESTRSEFTPELLYDTIEATRTEQIVLAVAYFETDKVNTTIVNLENRNINKMIANMERLNYPDFLIEITEATKQLSLKSNKNKLIILTAHLSFLGRTICFSNSDKANFSRIYDEKIGEAIEINKKQEMANLN